MTETSTRYSILTKQKHFREPNKKGLISNSRKLLGDTNDTAIQVDDVPTIIREESDEEVLNLEEVLDADEIQSDTDSLFVGDDKGPHKSKRSRATTGSEAPTDISLDPEPLSKRRKDNEGVVEGDETDDKKKMAMDTFYEGFSIYGRILCLVVKRIDKKGKSQANTGGQAMLEDWIASTQMPAQEEEG